MLVFGGYNVHEVMILRCCKFFPIDPTSTCQLPSTFKREQKGSKKVGKREKEGRNSIGGEDL
jgi:hypothetical protein